MCRIDFVIIMHELHLESEGVIETTTLLLECIWKVTDVSSVTVPTVSLTIIALCLFLRIEKWFHSLVVRTFRLNKIDNIELISSEFLDVLHSEVEPLSICRSIMIIFQDQVVFIFSHFDSSSQVTRFETGFKYQSFVIIIFFLVIGLELLIVSVKFWHFLIKSGAISRWTIWVIFSVVDWIFIRWKLNDVTFINVWSRVTTFSVLGSWVIHAVINDLLVYNLIIHLFLHLKSSKLVAHLGIELVNLFEFSAVLLKSRSIFQKWLIDTGSW